MEQFRVVNHDGAGAIHGAHMLVDIVLDDRIRSEHGDDALCAGEITQRRRPGGEHNQRGARCAE